MPIIRVSCWALLFSLRLRFPPGTTIAAIYHQYHLQILIFEVRLKHRLILINSLTSLFGTSRPACP